MPEMFILELSKIKIRLWLVGRTSPRHFSTHAGIGRTDGFCSGAATVEHACFGVVYVYM